ncbi:AAA family ATPase [Burkholderia sp. MBR-1]|uniref:AAA family ATPase n=1 Tax=Burkholderia sp. MBR-1 TaxID=2732364 RepID=UPI0015EE92F8|nr:AAA family ATPase [Burkholderia sp. MBR-1]QMI49778.1 AAA domain-containing protein [Burkholderia sp. MBR-1]
MSNVAMLERSVAAEPAGDSDEFAYIDEIFDIEVPKASREAARIRVTARSEDTPDRNPHYVVTKDAIRCAQQWINSDARKNVKKLNFMLTGPTGSGKTTLVEQISSRCGWGVVKISCHGQMELGDLIGNRVLDENGGMVWADGPVIRAMREGKIALFDEMNFLQPEIVGGLNTILDGGSYYIAQTGERVNPHINFRIAATGNALNGVDTAKYRGVKRQNDALLDRFLLGLELDYLDRVTEEAILSAMYPNLQAGTIKVMMDVVTATRNAQKNTELGVAISTRVLLDGWAMNVHRAGNDPKKQLETLLPALKRCMLFRVPADDRIKIEAALEGVLKRK